MEFVVSRAAQLRRGMTSREGPQRSFQLLIASSGEDNLVDCYTPSGHGFTL